MARQGKKQSSPKQQAQKPQKPLSTRPFEIEITGIANGGAGIGKAENRTYFVPFTIPGETLMARIKEDKGRYAFAEGITMLDASGDRVMPKCVHFGPNECAICHWQHMKYTAQLALKTDILIDQLERIGKFKADDLVIHPTIKSPTAWNYKTQADFYRTAEGGLGYSTLSEERAMGISECHIVHPRVMELYNELNLDIENLNTLRIQVSTDGDAMVTIKTWDEEAPELESEFPVSVNFLLNDNVPVNLVGKTHIIQTLLGKPFRITAGVQFRANPAQHAQLIELVLDSLALSGEETVLDLYGGVGIFSAFLAPLVSHVTYVESYPPAATDAEENLEEFENVDILEGAVEEILPYLLDEGEIIDIAIVDPPRSGLSADAVDGLSKLDVPLIIYISDDPATLARDARRLVSNHGYSIIDIHPIDFEPQTASIQVVTIFERELDDQH